MQIQILSVTTVSHPTKKPGVTTPKLDLAYKNLTFQGKVEGKALFSFGANAGSYLALKDAKQGEVYDIEVVKNDAGFNDWVVAKKSDGATSPVTTPATSVGSVGRGVSATYTAAPKSTYPTEDERAKTQIYIVRQSNLNTAVATLAVGAKSLKPEDVIKTAKLYEDHVFGSTVSAGNDSVAPAAHVDITTVFDALDDLPR